MRSIQGSGGGEHGSAERALNDHPDYDVLYPLGAGGMGRLYLAWEERLKRLVVLKVPAEEHARDAELLAMFEREAHIAAQMKHPNLLGAYRLFDGADGPVLSMEYIDGVSYHALLERVGYERLGFERQLQLLIAVLSGLDHLHRLTDYEGRWFRLVHRDISPDNVMVGRDGRVTIIDFGIAKGRRLAELTRAGAVTRVPGTIKGKPAYMSPEQARGEIAVDARSDLYSVGVMLWEAAARRRRWGHVESEDAILRLVARSPHVEAPGAERLGLPSAVDRICVKALAPEPEERFQSAAEFRAELEALARELASDERETLSQLLEHEFGSHFQERQAKIRGARASRSGRRRTRVHDGPRESTRAAAPKPPRAAPPSFSSVLRLAPAVVLVALAGLGVLQLWQLGSVRFDESAASLARPLPDPAGADEARGRASLAPRPIEREPSVSGAVTSAEPRQPETATSPPSLDERVERPAAAGTPREQPGDAPRPEAARKPPIASGGVRGAAAASSRAPSRPLSSSAAGLEPAATPDRARASAAPSPPQPDEKPSVSLGEPARDRATSESGAPAAPADDGFERDRLHFDP